MFESVTIARILLVAHAAGMTVLIAAIGLTIGLSGGVLCGILASKRLNIPIARRIIDAYVFVVQGVPLFVQLLLVYFGLPFLLGVSLESFTAGWITVGLNSIAYVTQIVRGGINTVSPGQWEASFVLGYSLPATIWYIILPQVGRAVLPSLMNEVISLVKETSILGGIGVLELTKVSRDLVSRTSAPFTWYILAAVVYLLITSVLSFVAKRIERSLEYDFHH